MTKARGSSNPRIIHVKFLFFRLRRKEMHSSRFNKRAREEGHVSGWLSVLTWWDKVRAIAEKRAMPSVNECLERGHGDTGY